MKKIHALLFLTLSFQALAQTPLANLIYMDEITGSSLTTKSIPAVDHESNLLLAGTYLHYGAQSLVVQGDTLLSALNTTGDIVLLKMNPEGGLIWLKRIESDNEQYLQAMVADKTGHIILRFSHSAEATFSGVSLPPGITLLKLDPNGAHEWHNTLNGMFSSQYYNMLSLDCFDNIITGGNTTLHSTGVPIDTFIWPPDTIIQYQLAPDSIDLNGALYPPAGYQNMVLMKFLPDGSLSWLKQFPADAYIADISAEFGSDIVLSGTLHQADTLTLDNVTLIKSDTAAGVLQFYARFTEDGTALWAHSYFENVYPWDIRKAPDGSIYAGTEYYLTTTYQGVTFQSNGVQDILLFKLDSAGAFQWGRSMGDQYTNQISRLSVNKKGDVAVSGFTINSGEMGRKYDAQGNLLWVNPDNGDSGNNGTGPMVFDPEGNMWLVGWFNGDFGMGPYEFSIWGGPTYTFIAKFSDQDIPGPLYTCMQTSAIFAATEQTQEPVRLSPNPAGTSIEISGSTAFSKIRIFSVDGKWLASIDPPAEPTLEVDLSGFEPGLLFIECVDQNGIRSVQKLVKL